MEDITKLLDAKSRKRISQEPVPPLPIIKVKARTKRRWRHPCLCCGAVQLVANMRDNVCEECKKAGCSHAAASPTCPQRMKVTLHTRVSHRTPTLSTMGGYSSGTERDDDDLFGDNVIFEHLYRRNKNFFKGNIRLPADLPYENYSAILPTYQGAVAPVRSWTAPREWSDDLLVHQILTEQGWYFEQVEGFEGQVRLVTREVGLDIYMSRAGSWAFGENPDVIQGVHGGTMIQQEFRDAMQALGWHIGFEELVKHDPVPVFLHPHAGPAVLMRQIGGLHALIMEEMAPGEGRTQSQIILNALLRKFGQVKGAVTDLEGRVADNEKSTPEAAQRVMLLKHYLSRAGADLQLLIVGE